MVSVLLYVEVALSTRVCVNEYIVSLAGSVTPSLVHVTVVGGEPVEVQVRVVKEEEMFRSNVTRGAAGGKEMYGRRLFDIQYGWFLLPACTANESRFNWALLQTI